MTTSRKLWIAVIAGLLLSVGVLGGVKAMQIGAMVKAGGSFTPPPESVTVAKVEAGRWRPERSAIGTLVALRSVTVASEVPGSVKAIHFDSGQSVSRGALLVELDASAEASQLASAQAEVRLAAQTLDRMKSLRATGTNTQAELDIAVAREEQARAAVAGLQTTIAKKSIRAPFDGRLGVRTVELGQVLSPGTPLATLQSTSPMYAEFWLPQQALADLRTGMEARLVIDAYPRAEWTGAVSLVLPEVDVSTRSVRVRATFQNPEGRLRPGMYGSVALRAAEERPVLTIPSTAVLYAPYGDSVFTVQEQAGKQDGKAAGEKPPSSVAQQRFVQLGERRGDRITVESGLAAGETIVASGAFKLHNGSLLALKADPAAEPKTDAPAAGSELHTPVK